MPTPTRRAIRRLLDAVHLPITLYLGNIGRKALADPGLVDAATQPWLAYIWAASLTLGAVLVVVGVATGRTRMESAGHAFHVFGLAFLAAVEITAIGLDDVTSLAALIGVPLMRMRLLRRSRAAMHEAGRIVQREDRTAGHGRHRCLT